MTSTAVVTGSAARVDDVAQAMERRGVMVVRIDRAEDPGPVAAAIADGSVAYLVQLPGDVPSPRTTRVAALSDLFRRGVMSRFREIDALLPKLATNGAVVLVTGETVEELASDEYPHAPTCLLEMLADAIVADMAPAVVRATVVSHCHSADEIAEAALACGPQHDEVMAGFATRAPEMSYDDWRLAYLCRAGSAVTA
jgi:hypothetical protein